MQQKDELLRLGWALALSAGAHHQFLPGPPCVAERGHGEYCPRPCGARLPLERARTMLREIGFPWIKVGMYGAYQDMQGSHLALLVNLFFSGPVGLTSGPTSQPFRDVRGSHLAPLVNLWERILGSWDRQSTVRPFASAATLQCSCTGDGTHWSRLP